MSRSLALLLAVALLGACATPTVPVRRGTTMPHAVGVVCLSADGSPIALDDINCIDNNMRVIVSGIDSVGAAMPAQRTWLDVDPSTPGFTPLHMPSMPGAVAIDPLNGQGYIAIPLLGWVVRVNLLHLADWQFSITDWQDVGVFAQDLLIVQQPEPRLYMADPAGGKVWWLPLVEFGHQPIVRPIAVGGSPVSLAWSSVSQSLYVGHLATGYVSMITPTWNGPNHAVSQIGLVAQCRNGLDDDGDGKTDGDDSGCDGPDDRFEGNPELGVLCGNLIDDDGDGTTDGQDLGCMPGAGVTPTDGCRNGIDDDGDGLTDYSPSGGGDPGCSGWGDDTEWSEQVLCPLGGPGCKTLATGVSIKAAVNLCSDGIDNDGDGKTDLADPDCSVPGNAMEGPPACANGLDDDGDGLTDLGDPDCYNRGGLSEISPASALRTSVATTFDGRFVVIADRTRRALLVVDATTGKLLQPVPGQQSPYVRASRLDVRDGIPGMALADVPISLAAGQVVDTITTGDQAVNVYKPVMAIGLAQIGVEFIQFFPIGDTQTIAVDFIDVATDPTPTLTTGRPLLLVPGEVLDLPTTVPTRFAALGSSLGTDPLGNTIYYGLDPNMSFADQRAETWRFKHEALLPGGVSTRGRLLSDGTLHDPTLDFCQLGVLPGDMLQVNIAPSAACQGGGTFDFPVTGVHADRLDFSQNSGVLDVPVTYDNQLAFDVTARKPWTSALATCVADGGISYAIRAGGWLVRGSRTGILSTRPSGDGECTALSAADAGASRLVETTLLPGVALSAVTACPYADDVLDPTIWRATTFVHPAFSGVLSPGCDSSTYDANGDSIINLVPSIREAEWVYGLTAGGQPPRSTAAGANPVAMASGPLLDTLYVVDEGAGLLQFVRISDGLLLDTPLD